jgi:hypothetical protein
LTFSAKWYMKRDILLTELTDNSVHVTGDSIGTDDGIQGLSDKGPTVVHMPCVDTGLDNGSESEECGGTDTDQRRDEGGLHIIV